MFKLFNRQSKVKEQYSIVDTYYMSFEMSDIFNNSTTNRHCIVNLLATPNGKKKFISTPELPYGADNMFKMWVENNVGLEELRSIINKQTNTNTNTNTPIIQDCTDDDYKIFYGRRYEYTFTGEIDGEGNAILKLFSCEKILDKTYVEIIIDDTLYLKVYEDNTIYYSVDNREWKKSDNKDFIKSMHDRYLILTDEFNTVFKNSIDKQ